MTNHSAAPAGELQAIARRLLTENGFSPELSPQAVDELRKLAESARQQATDAALRDGARDLRSLPWSSIDNVESRDLDQVEVAESLSDGAIRLSIGIADVDLLVPCDAPLDQHAQENATSVYAGVAVFPMLPVELSEQLTSLAEGVDRVAIVVSVEVDAAGEVRKYDVVRAVVRNQAKLAYESVGAWLDGGAAPPELAGRKGIEAQLHLQREAAKRLRGARERAGALELDTIEARPVTKDGRVVDLAVTRKGLARDLIEDFMIAANVAIARFLDSHGSSGIRRVVRKPERWGRLVELAARHGATLPPEPDPRALQQFLAAQRAKDPERFVDLSLAVVKLLGPGEYALDLPGKDPDGHFGLAVQDYSHATAPNRRYADLVTQRLVKAVLAGRPQPYDNDTLAALARHCTEREDAARKVERQMRKVAAAFLLQSRIGQSFDAIVTGVTPKGTFVRLLKPPAEGRVVRGEQGMDVGDEVRVKLVGVDPEKGFIDLERA